MCEKSQGVCSGDGMSPRIKKIQTRQLGAQIRNQDLYRQSRFEAIIDQMFEAFAHSHPTHELALVVIHARKCTDMYENNL